MTAPEPVKGHPEPGMHVWGWTHPPELRWLREQAMKMESVVEVGSLRGRSAFALLTGCPGPVYCIDPWNDDAGHSLPAFMEACGGFANLVVVQGLSPEVEDQVPEVDMTFIDGLHTYEQVVLDIEAWEPKTRKLICGHDYLHGGYPGVRQAVDERYGDRVTVPDDTSIWAVRLDA